MSISQRIKEARIGAGLSQADLAGAVGLTRNAVSLWENGKNRPTSAMLDKVADVLNVKVYWLLTGDTVLGGAGREASVPEIDVRAGAGGGGVATAEYMQDEDGNTFEIDGVRDHWGIPLAYMRNELRVRPTTVRIIEIIGDSMEPTLRSGDRVMVDESHQVPSPPGIYALHDGMGLIVKRVEFVHGSEPQTIRIISDNDRHLPYERTLEEANIIGRVVWRATPL